MLKDPDYYINGVLSGNRRVLSKTITLIESSLAAHQEMASRVIDSLLPHTGKSIRLGITGVPGAGKSTFIESFGLMLANRGHKVAVLAVDPSSSVTGGSILADKTRMERLSVAVNAYIRPSPSGSTLGGVARKTRESLLACEAAGFDVILVETVGVGQNETTVASMVDFFLVLMIAGAGDELQGIKKGVLELADAIAVNKADGDNIERAQFARSQYEGAVHLLTPAYKNWTTPVLTCSALAETGLDEVWNTMLDFQGRLSESGELEGKRKKQALDWMRFVVEESLKDWFYANPEVSKSLSIIKKKVEDGVTSPMLAAAELLAHIDRNS